MKILFTLTIVLIALGALAQNSPVTNITKALIPHAQHKTIAGKDTVIESDTSKENKEPRYYYFSVLANMLVNTKGDLAKRFSPGLEFGRTYGIFDIGLGVGSIGTLSSGRDTAHYIEFRPTINIFSAGRFAEGLLLGGGYIFGAKQALMTEICNSINFNISTNVAIAITQSYLFFDGTNSNRSGQYMGFSFTYNFLKPHSVNKQRKKAAIIKDN
ncbi:hypothetical protein SAMN05421821_102117 [Mucilaginibacter lappiensis]|uniref:Lipid A 3-O-deacylase (PagL) n=1 Tax=Mucilaginibacter lappiensis TaxID=354630 RepID=A0ABR6PFW5_9SPHI|nr:hypothetical protein [Mucilaginibacter lappiensis]MBB6108648.1 hypothetical protein [Mucilaginibacter lappiensis]SIQ29431.1 hypothetical protein SAMN05421821_102117 [Mucilaginibacter lappiensis]